MRKTYFILLLCIIGIIAVSCNNNEITNDTLSSDYMSGDIKTPDVTDMKDSAQGLQLNKSNSGRVDITDFEDEMLVIP